MKNTIPHKLVVKLKDARASAMLLPNTLIGVPQGIFLEALDELIEAVVITYKVRGTGPASSVELPSDPPEETSKTVEPELPLGLDLDIQGTPV